MRFASLKARVLSGLVVISVLLVTSAFISGLMLRSAIGSLERLSSQAIPATHAAMGAAQTGAQIAADIPLLAAARDGYTRQSSQIALQQKLTLFNQHLTNLHRLGGHDDMTARIESLAEVLATEARLINTLVHRLADVREGAAHPGDTEADLTETLNASVERARSASIRLASFVHREVARYQAATRQQLEETRAATDRMQILLLVLGGVVVFIALPFFWVYLGGQVVQRIDDLAAMARRLAAGDLSGGLPPRTRDELGDLAEGLIMARGAMIELQQSNEKLQQKSAELLTMAITDPLTGVANRRRFTEFAQIELDRSQRYNHPLSLVLMDLDHFKSINDRFGHDMGDRVLIHTATLLSQEIRGTDLVARYGGEEFILLLPEEPLDGALKLADRLRSLTEAQRLTTPDGGVVRWSISVGVVSMKRTDGGLHDLIRRADAALYRAKAAGRNHVEADS